MSIKVLAIIKREYITRAKTKGFIIGTLIFPLILIFFIGGIFIIGSLFKPSTKTFQVIDQTGKIYQPFTGIQSDTLKNGEPKYQFIKEEVTAAGLDAALEKLQTMVIQKEIDGYLLIPDDVLEKREVKYSARNVSDFEEQESFSRSLSWIVGNLRLEQKGLPVDIIRKEISQGSVRLASRQVTEKGEIEKSGISSFLLAYILTYVILLMMMIYGQQVMRSVIEEKTQRITETIISAVRPGELMLGKIIGICGLGLTQLTIFGGFMLLVMTYSTPLFRKFGVDIPELTKIFQQIHFTVPVFLFMLTFFLLGFIFFSSIFAALGAMVNSEDEGQQFQLPVIFLILIGYFIMFTVARNPDTTRAFWVSLIPLFTPIVMFARIAVSDPILPSGAFLSVFIMIVSTYILIRITAKIYRVGILMYGKKPSIKEAIKWLRYK
jgi:ABC-2 type transport system permease protein